MGRIILYFCLNFVKCSQFYLILFLLGILTGLPPAYSNPKVAVDVVHPIQDLHVTILHLLGLNDNKLTLFHEGWFK